jgi:hypothetical protein
MEMIQVLECFSVLLCNSVIYIIELKFSYFPTNNEIPFINVKAENVKELDIKNKRIKFQKQYHFQP